MNLKWQRGGTCQEAGKDIPTKLCSTECGSKLVRCRPSKFSHGFFFFFLTSLDSFKINGVWMNSLFLWIKTVKVCLNRLLKLNANGNFMVLVFPITLKPPLELQLLYLFLKMTSADHWRCCFVFFSVVSKWLISKGHAKANVIVTSTIPNSEWNRWEIKTISAQDVLYIIHLKSQVCYFWNI